MTRPARRLGEQVEYPGMTSHTLRHFHATLLQAGETNLLVSKRLGHANPGITKHVDDHELLGWQRPAAAGIADAMARNVN